MSAATYRVVKLAPGHGFELGAFDCGEEVYNAWLVDHAENSAHAGVCAVYLLVETSAGGERVVGYFAINPTQVLRNAAPSKLSRGWPEIVPAWKLGKLALHLDLRGDPKAEWGRQLLREALETIVKVADAGGGKVIVVDPDNAGLVKFYVRNGFKGTGVDDDFSLYMKISSARATLGG